jgi:uncharacterized protein GlcG (DUF336 family)
MDLNRRSSLSLELAQVAVRTAVEEASARETVVCVSVVDSSANAIAFARMDGTPLMSIKLAVDKAASAVVSGMDTDEFWSMMRENEWLVSGASKIDGLVVLGGGVLVRHGSEVVGGIGVSGRSTMEVDRAIAVAAATAVLREIGE